VPGVAAAGLSAPQKRRIRARGRAGGREGDRWWWWWSGGGKEGLGRRADGGGKESRWSDEGMETSNTIFTDAYALTQPAAGVPIRECLSYIYIVYCLLELITYIHTCTKLVNAGRVTVFRVRGQERLLREQKQALRASISRLAALSSQVSFGVASGG